MPNPVNHTKTEVVGVGRLTCTLTDLWFGLRQTKLVIRCLDFSGVRVDTKCFKRRFCVVSAHYASSNKLLWTPIQQSRKPQRYAQMCVCCVSMNDAKINGVKLMQINCYPVKREDNRHNKY